MRIALLALFVIVLSGCTTPQRFDWDKFLSNPDSDGETPDNDEGNTGNSGDLGNSGNSGDSGNTLPDDIGNTGNSGDTLHENDETTNNDFEDHDDIINEIELENDKNEISDNNDFENVDENQDEEICDEMIPDEDVEKTTIVVKYDFELSDQGWTHEKIDAVSAPWPFDMWEWGSATSGPDSCFDGNGCFGFNLSGNYINCQRAQLISPVIDLSSNVNDKIRLELTHWYDFWYSLEDAYYDGGLIEFSNNNGASWNQIPNYTYPGTIKIKSNGGANYYCETPTFYVSTKSGFVKESNGWEKIEIDIPLEMMTANFRMRFVFSSGVQKSTTSTSPSNYSYPGWYIDDITILKIEK